VKRYTGFVHKVGEMIRTWGSIQRQRQRGVRRRRWNREAGGTPRKGKGNIKTNGLGKIVQVGQIKSEVVEEGSTRIRHKRQPLLGSLLSRFGVGGSEGGGDGDPERDGYGEGPRLGVYICAYELDRDDTYEDDFEYVYAYVEASSSLWYADAVPPVAAPTPSFPPACGFSWSCAARPKKLASDCVLLFLDRNDVADDLRGVGFSPRTRSPHIPFRAHPKWLLRTSEEQCWAGCTSRWQLGRLSIRA